MWDGVVGYFDETGAEFLGNNEKKGGWHFFRALCKMVMFLHKNGTPRRHMVLCYGNDIDKKSNMDKEVNNGVLKRVSFDDFLQHFLQFQMFCVHFHVYAFENICHGM